MKRCLEKQLQSWFNRSKRKPLVLRGARQVGKSTLIRNFAKSQKLNLIEINLERYPRLDSLFKTNNINQILPELEAIAKAPVSTHDTLIFLDEIQTTPHALACLRYFYEDKPQLPIIAAGSLLEFVLSQHQFSMPVGRIEYLHLGPMSFQEFLLALGETYLHSQLQNFSMNRPLPEMVHTQLLQKQREYLFVGGMPESVLVYSQTKSLTEARHVQRSIIQTYQDDFSKYSQSYKDLELLHKVLDVMPKIAGQKVKYVQIAKENRSTEIKESLDLLIKACLIYPAYHSDCTGIPLKATVSENIYKLYFMDVGLLNYIAGLDWTEITHRDEQKLVNEGPLAEQFIAQHLAFRHDGFEPPSLFYWLREGKKTNAEVDFVMEWKQNILPIEVKSGKSGTLKSLQQFAFLKQSNLACRFDLNPASLQKVSHQLRQKDGIVKSQFQLLSLPLYLVENLSEILDSL